MTSSTPQAAPARPQALLIEDDSAVQDGLATVLKEHGYDVAPFATAGEAGRHFSYPHLIVIKAVPGDPEPLEFARWARRKSGQRQLFILAFGDTEALGNHPGAAMPWNDVLPRDAEIAVIRAHLGATTRWLAKCYPDLALPRTESATFPDQTGLKPAPVPVSAGGFGEDKRPAPAVADATRQPPITSSAAPTAGPPRKQSGSTMKQPAAAPPGPSTPRPDGDSGRMRQLLDHLPMAVALFDRELHYLAVNQRWLGDFNIAGTDVIGRSHYEIFPDLHENWKRVYQRALDGRTECSDEKIIDHSDGTRSWVRWEVKPWIDDGVIAGILISCQNITARKQAPAAEIARKQPAALPITPEPRIKPEVVDSAAVMLNSIDAPALALDLSGDIVFANRQLRHVLGNDALEGNKLWDIAGGGQQQSLRDACETVAAGVVSTGKLDVGNQLDFILFDDTGETFRLAWSAAPRKNADGELTGVSLFGTLRQQEQAQTRPAAPLEAQIKQLEARIASQADSAADAASQLKTLGEEKEGALEQWREAASRARELERKLAGAKSPAVEIAENAPTTRPDADDLTKHVLDSLPAGIAVLDGDANTVYCNEAFNDLLGLSLEQCGGIENWLRRGSPDAEHCSEVVTTWWERVWRAHTPKVFSLSDTGHVLRDIELRPKALANKKGRHVLLVASDVTDKRRAEDALRISEARFLTLFRECGVGISVVDRNGAILNVNPFLERMLATNLVELRREKFESLLDARDIPIKRELETRLRGGDPNEAGEVDVRMLRKDGEPIAVTLRSALVRNRAGKELFTAFFIRERAASPMADSPTEPLPTAAGLTPLAPISTPAGTGNEDQSKVAAAESAPEAPVADSLESRRNAALLEATTTPILITDGNGTVLKCNAAAEDFLQTGIGVLSGQPLAVLFEGMDTVAFQESLLPTLKESGSFHGDVMVSRGSKLEECSLRLFGVNDPAGELTSVIAAIDPDPDPKLKSDSDSESESATATASIADGDPDASGAGDPGDNTVHIEGVRDCLHQIKNHLQILMSLQNLRTKKPGDPAAESALLSTRNRLNAVAHVYQNVGTAEQGASTIPFHVAGEALLQSLRRGWRDARPDVILEWRMDAIHLHTGRAVPLALVLNELVTNAFENSFPEGRGGGIQVRLGVGPGHDMAALVVADTGIMAAESDDNPGGQSGQPAEQGGQEMEIVKSLTEQLGGTLCLSSDGRPEFRIVFPLSDPGQPSSP